VYITSLRKKQRVQVLSVIGHIPFKFDRVTVEKCGENFDYVIINKDDTAVNNYKYCEIICRRISLIQEFKSDIMPLTPIFVK
jgi:hypothetical protein